MNEIVTILTAGNGVNLLYFLIVLPAVLSLLCLVIPRTSYFGRATVFLAAAAVNLVFSISLFSAPDFTMLIPWANFNMDLALRVYNFSRFAILCTSVVVFLVALYSVAFLKKTSYSGAFFFYFLLNLALVNGVFLANNLVVLLFFWEGMMVVLFGMLVLVKRDSVKTAVKALVLNGIADLCLMLGVAITYQVSGSLMMDAIHGLPIENLGTLGFVFMMLGALGKAGAMPFHSWIPNAADDAPLPFMAILPGALEKLLGIYLLVRVSVGFYNLRPGSVMSMVMMWIGALTLLLAVSMALIQKDMKRLLSFHAISQVGYMVLGIGTALPIGIVGGLFHMLNNAIYKCCLFLTAGQVEKATGTTNLKKVGGLGRWMPLTAISFLLAALAISGVPPFNGFFSKELIFDAALESGTVFYVLAVLGAFGTAASFLKLGHAAFFGPTRLPEKVKEEAVHEAPAAMLIPEILLALACLGFGLLNHLPIGWIQNLLGDVMPAGVSYSGWPHSLTLVLISCGVLLLAVLNHIFGYRRTGAGIQAVDHIHYAPGLRQIYAGAENHYYDPYEIFMGLVQFYAWVCWCIDRAFNWFYDVLLVRLISFFSNSLKTLNTGNISNYMLMSFAGVGFLILLFVVLM